MRTLLFPILLLSGAAFANQPMSASEVKSAIELAKNNGCFSCHGTAEKIVGPAYTSIAAKYRGEKDAVASLVQSIQYGSKGKWGRIPMPAHASMGSDDLNLVARWVMTVEK